MMGARWATRAREARYQAAVKAMGSPRRSPPYPIVKWEPPPLGSFYPAGTWGLAWLLERWAREILAMRIRHEVPSQAECEASAASLRLAQRGLADAEIAARELEARAQRKAWLDLGLWSCIDGTEDAPLTAAERKRLGPFANRGK